MKLDEVGQQRFLAGDWVRKTGGDYDFKGRVVCAFAKYSRDLLFTAGTYRYVVQNREGILHIFNQRQLESCDEPG